MLKLLVSYKAELEFVTSGPVHRNAINCGGLNVHSADSDQTLCSVTFAQACLSEIVVSIIYIWIPELFTTLVLYNLNILDLLPLDMSKNC